MIVSAPSFIPSVRDSEEEWFGKLDGVVRSVASVGSAPFLVPDVSAGVAVSPPFSQVRYWILLTTDVWQSSDPVEIVRLSVQGFVPCIKITHVPW